MNGSVIYVLLIRFRGHVIRFWLLSDLLISSALQRKKIRSAMTGKRKEQDMNEHILPFPKEEMEGPSQIKKRRYNLIMVSINP